MKKNLSVLMLAARTSIYHIAAIMAVMAAAESALLYYNLEKICSGSVIYSISEMFASAKVPLIFGTAFLFVCFILAATGCEFLGSRVRYTIQRLSVKEPVTVHLWAVYNAAVLFVLWALQIAIAFGFSKLYMQYMSPEYTSGMSIFIAFADDGFLHSLLPVFETTRYVRNVVLILALGETIAVFSYKMRRDVRDFNLILLAAIAIVGFKAQTGAFTNDMLVIILSLIISGASAYCVFRRRDENEA